MSKVGVSCGNVFADLGLPDAERLIAECDAKIDQERASRVAEANWDRLVDRLATEGDCAIRSSQHFLSFTNYTGR